MAAQTNGSDIVSAMDASAAADGGRVLSYEEKLALYKKQRELSLERDAVVAISFLLNETFSPDETVSESIADGEVLNRVALAMSPNKSTGPQRQQSRVSRLNAFVRVSENVNSYVRVCRQLGIPNTYIFTAEDLKNPNRRHRVLTSLIFLSRWKRQQQGPRGPTKVELAAAQRMDERNGITPRAQAAPAAVDVAQEQKQQRAEKERVEKERMEKERAAAEERERAVAEERERAAAEERERAAAEERERSAAEAAVAATQAESASQQEVAEPVAAAASESATEEIRGQPSTPIVVALEDGDKSAEEEVKSAEEEEVKSVDEASPEPRSTEEEGVTVQEDAVPTPKDATAEDATLEDAAPTVVSETAAAAEDSHRLLTKEEERELKREHRRRRKEKRARRAARRQRKEEKARKKAERAERAERKKKKAERAEKKHKKHSSSKDKSSKDKKKKSSSSSSKDKKKHHKHRSSSSKKVSESKSGAEEEAEHTSKQEAVLDGVEQSTAEQVDTPQDSKAESVPREVAVETAGDADAGEPVAKDTDESSAAEEATEHEEDDDTAQNDEANASEPVVEKPLESILSSEPIEQSDKRVSFVSGIERYRAPKKGLTGKSVFAQKKNQFIEKWMEKTSSEERKKKRIQLETEAATKWSSRGKLSARNTYGAAVNAAVVREVIASTDSEEESELSYSSLDETEEEEEEVSSADEVEGGSDDSAFEDMNTSNNAFADL